MQHSSINIFDRNFYKLNLKRSVKLIYELNFLITETSENICERLGEISKPLDKALIYGLFDTSYLANRNYDITRGVIIPEFIQQDQPFANTIIYDEELIPFQPNSFDLIISNLSLHTINDLPGTLLQYRNILRPNGLFIATLFGPDTLKELRDAFLKTDLEFYAGAYPRVMPFIEIRAGAGLLSRAGFTMPISDSYTICAQYKRLVNLLRDIKGTGQNNCLIERNKLTPPKKYFDRVEQLYKKNHDLRVSFEIITITGSKT